jgi:D-lactate dehydrogenase (cytochrome)
MSSSLIHNDVEHQYPDYLRDESRRSGSADSISFPLSEDDIQEVISSTDGPLTVQGGRTGITAGAVPDGGHILNLSRMSSILGMTETGNPEAPYSITVQPGITLALIREAVAQRSFDCDGWSAESKAALASFKTDKECFFPPDPTEDSAAIGGMISCNASGARSFKYGPTRNYVVRLRAVTAAGDVIELTRDKQKADGLRFSIAGASTTIDAALPSYTMPDVKNASGYYSSPGMSLLDLLVGSEGTLAVISEAELLLAPAPAHNWAIMAFLQDTDSAITYVEACRKMPTPAVAALEFFDGKAIDLLRQQKASNPAFSFLPELNDHWHACVYVELDGHDESEIEKTAVALAELIEAAGVPEDATWMATASAEMARMKKFRHALPEAVNLTIDKYRSAEPGITKLGTDFAVPDEQLQRIMAVYRKDLEDAGLEYVIFGHIGDSHVHVNILSSSVEQYDTGKALYLKWAKTVVAMGGTVSAEHGIGKMKTALLVEMFGEDGIEQMRSVKRAFDPGNRINPGNLFSAKS